MDTAEWWGVNNAMYSMISGGRSPSFVIASGLITRIRNKNTDKKFKMNSETGEIVK